ncbi:sulfotransferase [Nostoc sp. CHAB 5784]|uniref:sulfotransferase n=1 Tax=Nostoc mirabile TaxID=2907820 RepID=UPI001E44E28C|nr:sulfotransferase [Nostoc mirabile]MCC5669942.1 sulfotransferase [Nostoc mirabile CHAB5784]
MEIFSGTFLLRQKALQKKLNHLRRSVFDLNYRHYWQDFNHLQNILSNTRQVEEDIEPEKLKGWTPIRLNLSPKSQSVAWLDLGQVSFTDAGLIETIYRSWQLQNKPQPIWTKLDVLTALKDVSQGLKPKGFIFNISKCGSTLLSKMLSSLPRNLIISEPGTIVQAMEYSFRADNDSFSDSSRIELLEGFVNALGQPRLGIEENYIIRLHPRNTLDLPFIRKVFPEVPWIFLYRDPAEVIISNIINPPEFVTAKTKAPYLVRQKINSSAIDITRMSPEHPHLVKQMLELSASDIARMSTEEYQARGLGILLQIAVQNMDNNALVINYEQLLSESCLCQVLDFFKIKVSDDELANMSAQKQFYSKEFVGKKVYRDDRGDKQKMGSEKLRDAVDKWAMEPYRKLEELKLTV